MLRKLTRSAVLAVTLVGLAFAGSDSALADNAGTSSASAAAAPAAVVTPAYYLYTTYTGRTGPCNPKVTDTHPVTVSLSSYRLYQTVYRDEFTEGNMKYVHYTDRGFATAWRYGSCWVGSGWAAYKYYGQRKVKRARTQTWLCYATGCNYVRTSFGAWSWGW